MARHSHGSEFFPERFATRVIALWVNRQPPSDAQSTMFQILKPAGRRLLTST